jgi:hypothetical protein
MPRVECSNAVQVPGDSTALRADKADRGFLASASPAIEMLGVKAWLSRAATAAHHFCRPSTIEPWCLAC